MPKTTATNIGTDDNNTATTEAITNRRFVDMIRAKLDAEGHQDIEVSRQWIDEDTPGESFLLNVPVGAALTVPLRPRDAFFRTEGQAYIASHAEHFAKALVTLRQAERLLVKYAQDIRRAAAKAVATARSEELDVLLADVAFKPTYAWHLTGSSWKESAYHVLAVVKLRHTSFYLRPKISSVIVEEPGDVAKELADIFEEERERKARIAYMDGLGADLIVDAITMDLLRAHVADIPDVLRDAWKRQHTSIPISVAGFETSLTLTTSSGVVESGLALPESYWNGEVVWMLGDHVENGLDLVGGTLAGRVSHPALACRTVTGIDRNPEGIVGPDQFHLDGSGSFLFDADTGHIRSLPTSLAA